MANSNYKEVKQVLWIILIANFVVAIIKIGIGTIIQSTSMTADGFHAISDGSSNIVGLIGIGFASKPIDKEHPYGHNKFEIISSLFIGVMLLFIAIKIAFEAMGRFISPVNPNITIESLIALIITIFINIFVTTYENKKGKQLSSYILVSDSLHTKSDIFVSVGVLITLIGIKLGLPIILDPIVSLIVSVFVLHASYEIFKQSMGILVDQASVDESLIKDIVFEFDEVKDVHNIRSRGSENNIYIDLHIMISPNINVEQSHKLEHNIESRIQKQFNINTEVIIHIEPFYE